MSKAAAARSQPRSGSIQQLWATPTGGLSRERMRSQRGRTMPVLIRPIEGPGVLVVANPWAVPTANLIRPLRGPCATCASKDAIERLQARHDCLFAVARLSQPASSAFTASLIIFPSAFLPASFAIAAFITPPMSFMEEAPVSAMAAATACSISSCEAAWGK